MTNLIKTDSAICTGQNVRYIARVRHAWLHSWTVKSKHHSVKAAVTAASKAFVNGGYKKSGRYHDRGLLRPHQGRRDSEEVNQC